MSQDVFKGVIGTGTIEAEFLSDASNRDSDILAILYARRGGGHIEVDRDVTAPGGRASVKVEAADNGLLEVWVSIGEPSDRGQLRVTCDGQPRDDELVQGSVRWTYSVQSGA